MKNNLDKTIEQLEKKNIETQTGESYLITTCRNLRKKLLKDFEVEDLRIMIGQNIGLKYLIPIATKVLENNILAEGDYYQGDLLKSVLTSEKEFWITNQKDWKKIIEIFDDNEILLNETELTWQIRKDLFLAFENFKKIN